MSDPSMGESCIYGTKVTISILTKVGLDFSEIALFYYQTIPREILHRINHKPAKINDGPKVALMRPCPLWSFRTLTSLHEIQLKITSFFWTLGYSKN